jgi:hypothetical protein
MEPRFGQDFSHVRVHSDAVAERSARDVNARAYTVGSDIVFGAGQSAPGSLEGQRLLAHELTHVVQQSGGAERAIQRQPDDAASHMLELGLEIHPRELQFEQTRVGMATYRQVAIINRTTEPVQFGGFVGMSGPPPPIFGPPSPGFGPRPIHEAPRPLVAHYAYSGAFKVIDDPRQHTVGPQGSIEAWINFTPTDPGTHSGMFWVVSNNGDAIGRISLTGSAIALQHEKDVEAATRQAAADAEAAAALDDTPSRDLAVSEARGMALDKLGPWQVAANKAITKAHNMMVSEWSDYLHKTSSNPIVSAASVPHAAFLEMLAEHTVGALAAKKAEHLIEHTAKHLAVKGALGVAGAEVGSIAGPPGALIGFAVGVLIETICGMIFHSLSGDDAEIKNMIREAYDAGFSAGSHTSGKLLGDKLKQLDGKQEMAELYQSQQLNIYRRLIKTSQDVDHLARVTAEIEAHTDLANAAEPSPGFADELLALWLREHAAGPDSAAKDVNKEQWKKVAEEMKEKRARSFDPEAQDGGLEQPNLFVTQCMHEWALRGLTTPPEFQEAIAAELAGIGIAPDTTSETRDPGYLSSLAQAAQQRFNRREFAWTNVFDLKDIYFPWYKSRQKTPQYEGERDVAFSWKDDKGELVIEGVVNMVDEVLCYPVLAVKGNTCYVEEFHYQMKAYGNDITAISEPGGKWNEYFTQGPFIGGFQRGEKVLQQAESGELNRFIAELSNFGLTVEALADAKENGYVQNLFGADVAVSRIQHVDGRDEPIKVFHVSEPIKQWSSLTSSYQREEFLEKIFIKMQNFESRTKAGMRMLRGGNTILILE